LFTALPDNQPEVLGYLKQICELQKQLAKQQQQMQECLDMLIAVLSESLEPPNMPVLPTFISSVPVTPVPPALTLSVPDPDSLTASSSQSADDNVIFQLQSGSTSERNFPVQLLRHMFTPSELAGAQC